MKIFNLGNGHTLEVEKANRGIEGDYKVTFKEDGKALFGCEYYSKDALEFEYDITLHNQKTEPERLLRQKLKTCILREVIKI